jgi:hypothetical protein
MDPEFSHNSNELAIQTIPENLPLRKFLSYPKSTSVSSFLCVFIATDSQQWSSLGKTFIIIFRILRSDTGGYKEIFPFVICLTP